MAEGVYWDGSSGSLSVTMSGTASSPAGVAQAVRAISASGSYYNYCQKHSYVMTAHYLLTCPYCEQEKQVKEKPMIELNVKYKSLDRSCGRYNDFNGAYIIFTSVEGDSGHYNIYNAQDEILTHCSGCFKAYNLELIESENMTGQLSGNALSRLAKSLFNGRVKKFIEVGFLTKDLEVTEKFTRNAMAIVMEDLLSHKESDAELTVSEVGRRLETQADEELAESKEKSCCK